MYYSRGPCMGAGAVGEADGGGSVASSTALAARGTKARTATPTEKVQGYSVKPRGSTWRAAICLILSMPRWVFYQ